MAAHKDVKVLGYYAVVTIELRATKNHIGAARAVAEVSWPVDQESIQHTTTIPILCGASAPSAATIEAVTVATRHLREAEGWDA